MVQLSIQNGKLVRRQNKLAIGDCCCGGGDPAAPCILSSVSSVNDLSVEFAGWTDHGTVFGTTTCYDCDALLNGTHVLSATADLATYLDTSNTNLGPRDEWRLIWDPFVWFKSLGQVTGHLEVGVGYQCPPGGLFPIVYEVMLIATLGYVDNITVNGADLSGDCALTVETYFFGLSGGSIFPTRSLPAAALVDGNGVTSTVFERKFPGGPVNPNSWSGLSVPKILSGGAGTSISCCTGGAATCSVSSVP